MKAVSGTLDDSLFQSERYSVFSYEIPVPISSYEVNIYLAEL